MAMQASEIEALIKAAFPDAENAEDSFVKFVKQDLRAPNATRMFLRR